MKKEMRGYYFITDSGLSKAGNLSDVKNAVKAGACMVQYRNKPGETLDMLNEAVALRKICGKVPFVINDRIDIAIASGADGVHLGQSDMPYAIARRIMGKNKIIGITVHNKDEALRACAQGADYIAFSPVFSTGTKPDAGRPGGLKLLREAACRSSVPMAAIGGITLKNAPEVFNAGADCVCAISAVITKKDVKAEIEKFIKLCPIRITPK